ncbi:hypothetical protein J6590_066290 [Homalodisca vitripennis]|nr:hypothetical protein J6590_066290 [Homalodisca vitripennis]
MNNQRKPPRCGQRQHIGSRGAGSHKPDTDVNTVRYKTPLHAIPVDLYCSRNHCTTRHCDCIGRPGPAPIPDKTGVCDKIRNNDYWSPLTDYCLPTFVTSEPPLMAGQAGCLQGQNRSAVTHTSSSYARRYLIWLSCDNRCTRYTTPDHFKQHKSQCSLLETIFIAGSILFRPPLCSGFLDIVLLVATKVIPFVFNIGEILSTKTVRVNALTTSPNSTICVNPYSPNFGNIGHGSNSDSHYLRNTNGACAVTGPAESTRL